MENWFVIHGLENYFLEFSLEAVFRTNSIEIKTHNYCQKLLILYTYFLIDWIILCFSVLCKLCYHILLYNYKIFSFLAYLPSEMSVQSLWNQHYNHYHYYHHHHHHHHYYHNTYRLSLIMIEASTSTIPDIVTLIESNQTYINIVKKTIVFLINICSMLIILLSNHLAQVVQLGMLTVCFE